MTIHHISTPEYANPGAVACGRVDRANVVTFDNAKALRAGERLGEQSDRVCCDCLRVMNLLFEDEAGTK